MRLHRANDYRNKLIAQYIRYTQESVGVDNTQRMMCKFAIICVCVINTRMVWCLHFTVCTCPKLTTVSHAVNSVYIVEHERN